MSLFYIDNFFKHIIIIASTLMLIGLCLQSSDRCVSHLDKLRFGVFIGWFHLQPGLQTLLQYRPGHRIAAFLRHYCQALTPVFPLCLYVLTISTFQNSALASRRNCLTCIILINRLSLKALNLTNT